MKKTICIFFFLILVVCFLSACGKAETDAKPYLSESERNALEQQFFADLSVEVFEDDEQYAEISLHNACQSDLLKVRIYQAETKELFMEIARLQAGTEARFIEYGDDWKTLLEEMSAFYMDYVVGDYQYRSRDYSVKIANRPPEAVFYLETDDGLMPFDPKKGISFENGAQLSGLKNYLFYEIRPNDIGWISPSYGRLTPYHMNLECRAEKINEKEYTTLVVKVKDEDGLIYDSNSLWIDSSKGTGNFFFYTSYQTGIPAGEYILHFEVVE